MVKGTEGSSKNGGKSKRTSNRMVIDPAPATVAGGNRGRSDGEEMTNAPTEKSKILKSIVGIIISGPNTASQVANPATGVAPDFAPLHMLAETSAVAEQLLNASHTNQSSK